MNVYFMGERVPEPVDHPVIRPSINAMAETFRLATEQPALATAHSAISDRQVNRFLHVPVEPAELVGKHEMQRELGRRTGTCFQRCVGLDAIGSCHSVTFDIDAKNGTDYHQRFLAFLKRAQAANIVIGGAMTDPKGDRSKPPHQQSDKDLFLRVTRRDDNGIYVSGAKMHQTGAVNSHWLIFMPTMRMTENDRDWSVVGAVRVDAPGLTYIVGRQTNDTRIMDGGALDAGNAQFAGQESLIVFDNVFVPHEHVFMDGEWAYASSLVERFTTYHRSSYVCKTGLGDVLIGAAATAAEHNGVEGVSHIKDKLVEMTHLNETIYSSCMAAAHQSKPVASGAYINDEMLSNVAKHNVTRFPYRDRAARPGHCRRPDRHHAVGEGFAEQRSRPAHSQIPARPRRRRGRRPHAHAAPDREHDHRAQCRRLSDREPARRRLAAGAAHPDRARHEDRREEGAGAASRRHNEAVERRQP